MDVMLEICSVTKTFGGLVALDDVSFEVTKGQVFGLYTAVGKSRA